MSGKPELLSARLRRLAKETPYGDAPNLIDAAIEAAEALERHLIASLDDLRSESERKDWRWVRQSMPSTEFPDVASNKYLVWFQDEYAVLEFDVQCGWRWGDGSWMQPQDATGITHWMPLPASPERGQSK